MSGLRHGLKRRCISCRRGSALPAAATATHPCRKNCTATHLQEFLKVFEQLRDEIVNDEVLAGQPESSKKWVKEVRPERR
jgi:hypothetical protein